MKLSLKKNKALCCILLSLILAFSNVSAVFSGFCGSKDKNQVYAANYYKSWTYIDQIYLNKNVDLTGVIYYTYYYDPVDNRCIFYSIDALETYLVGDTSDYRWYPGTFSYILNSDGSVANITIKGKLKEIGWFWDTIRDVKEDYSIYF